MKLFQLAVAMILLGCQSNGKLPPPTVCPVCPTCPVCPAPDPPEPERCLAHPITQQECQARMTATGGASSRDPAVDFVWDGLVGGPDLLFCGLLPQDNTRQHSPTCPPLSVEECRVRVTAALGSPARFDTGIDLNKDGWITSADLLLCDD